MLRNNKLIILMDQFLYSGTSFLTTVLLARSLSMNSYGLYSGVVLSLFLVLSILNSIVIQPFQVNVAKAENKDAYITFSFWFNLSIILCIGLFVFLIGLYFESIRYSFSIIFFGILFLIQDFFRKSFLALNRYIDTLILDLIYSISQAFVLTFIIYSHLDDTELCFRWLSFGLIPVLIVGWFRIHPFSFDFSKWRVYLSQHISQGKWLVSTSLIQWWSSNLLIVTSSIYLGVQALGALRLAQSVFGFLNVILQTFENYVLPQTAAKIELNNDTAISYLQDISKKTFPVFGFILLIIFLFSNQLMLLLGGSEYISYAYLLQGMSVLYIFIFLSQPIRIAIRSLILNQYFFYGYLVSLSFSICFSDFLLSHFQLMGTIIGLIISQIILIVFWQFILVKKNFILWKLFI